MTFIFRGGDDSLDIRKKFLERLKYKEEVNFANYPFLDTWYEKPNYGLLNENYEPIVLLNNIHDVSLYSFGYGSERSNIKCAKFVVEAFNQFRASYSATIENSPVGYPKFLESLAPVKGYKNFDNAYKEYISHLVGFYVEELLENKEIRHYRDYEKEIKNIFKNNLVANPITRSGFLLSPLCPVNVSGLYIEMAPLDYSEDLKKGEIIQDYNFTCYLLHAYEHGFMVDKNAPWRLVANLDSPKMRDHVQLYHHELEPETILNKFFRLKTHYDDIYSLQNIVLRVYSSFIKESPIGEKIDNSAKDFKPKKNTFLRDSTPTPSMVNDYKYWISFLLEVRMIELGMPMDNFEKLKNKVLDYHDVYGVRYSNAGKNYLNPASGKIGRICSEYIKSVYKERYDIADSGKLTKLGDYHGV